EPDDARGLAAASGKTMDEVGAMTRLDLAKAVLANPANEKLNLKSLTEKFRVHVYGFGSRLVPLVSTGDSIDDEVGGDKTPADQKIRARLAELRAADPSTRIGQAVSFALDTFSSRSEPVAGVIVVSDGQQNGGGVTPRDTAVFEFDVHAKGFEGRTVPVEVQALDDSGAPRGSPLAVSPGEVVLKG